MDDTYQEDQLDQEYDEVTEAEFTLSQKFDSISHKLDYLISNSVLKEIKIDRLLREVGILKRSIKNINRKEDTDRTYSTPF